MRLGIVIKEYREKNKISMDEFSRRSGISKAYVGFLENGMHPKTKKIIHPSIEMIKRASRAMSMDFDTLFNMIDEEVSLNIDDDTELVFTDINSNNDTVKIPVLGRVAAGNPIDAIENIIDYIEIPQSMTKHGDFFGLIIKGDSMFPRIHDGDTVIVLKTSTANSGNIIIASVNDSEVVCKKYYRRGKKAVLKSLNPEYSDIDVSNNPDFRIIGVVVELRAKIKNL